VRHPEFEWVFSRRFGYETEQRSRPPVSRTLTGLLEELDRSPACYSEPLLGRVCCGSLSSVKRCKHSYCAGSFELKISQLPIDTSMATKNNANASRGQNLRLQFAKRIGRTLKRP